MSDKQLLEIIVNMWGFNRTIKFTTVSLLKVSDLENLKVEMAS